MLASEISKREPHDPVEEHGVEKIKTVGDCSMAAAGFDGRAHDGAIIDISSIGEARTFFAGRPRCLTPGYRGV
jgi:class 3 adenylate cyclase